MPNDSQDFFCFVFVSYLFKMEQQVTQPVIYPLDKPNTKYEH